MSRRVLTFTFCVLAAVSQAAAQTPSNPPRPAQPAQQPRNPNPPQPAAPQGPPQAPQPSNPPRPAGPPQGVPPGPRQPLSNIKLDLTITDTYSAATTKKTVTMLLAAGGGGMIRTSNVLERFSVLLNIDANATIVSEGVVRANVTFEYTPAQGGDPAAAGPRPAQLHESITVLLKNGQPLLVSQSADPATDRKVTVELTATELK